MNAYTIAGAALLTGGASALGVSLYLTLRKRVRLLAAFVSAADHIEAEISFGLAPLPEILEELAGMGGALEAFWRELIRSWTQEERFSKVWSEAVRGLGLKEQDKLLLDEIGRIMGRYDAQRQAARLAFVRKRLEASHHAARDELIKNGRLFCVMGLVCGLALTIILI